MFRETAKSLDISFLEKDSAARPNKLQNMIKNFDAVGNNAQRETNVH